MSWIKYLSKVPIKCYIYTYTYIFKFAKFIHKVTTRRQVQDVEPTSSSLTKWTKLTRDEDTQDSSASLRAQATKARLHELDTEMFEQNEKQLAREKRSAQLKQFLIDSDIETVRSDRD